MVSEQWLPPGTGLVVEQETATLSYVDGAYHCTIQRALYNAGPEPVIRYPVRIAVDRWEATLRQIATDALWARSPAFTRPGARAALWFAGVSNLTMALGFGYLASRDEEE